MITTQIPYRLTNKSVGDVFSDVLDEHKSPKSDVIIFDFINIDFVETSGLTGLINLIEWLKLKGISMRFCNFERSSEVIKYLDDIGFFKRYLNKTVFSDCQSRNSTFDLIEMSYRHSWLDNTLITWIANRTDYYPSSFDDLKTALLEVLGNIKHHSQTNIGCVFAQYYPRTGEILISISDFGVGIPYNVNLFLGHNLIHDYLSIEMACQNKFTTGSTVGNAGLGLPLLIDIIAKKYKGYVEIISNKGYVRFTGENLIKSMHDEINIHPGCNIQIRFAKRHVENIEDNREDFEWA